ncbi:YkyB family protein [Peribacillus sp. JNUCC 23]|uniref:YkyB family protein n=1 Tax=Peribacillus sp. NPDC096379 TaxID=3364393 RepID=UPI0009E934AA
MNDMKGDPSSMSTINSLAQAIFVVNKHAKTAPEPKTLYELKRLSLNKLLTEGKAKKLGLHFSDNPRYSAQQSDVIVECGEYIFHLPPSREDLKKLPHLGSRSSSVRNPKTALSLSRAKKILQAYIGKVGEPKPREQAGRSHQHSRNKTNSAFQNTFPSSFLGKGFKL